MSVTSWTKLRAIARMKQKTLLAEVLKIEPRLQPIVEEAVRQNNVTGYNRIRKYVELKQRCYHLVGMLCPNTQIQSFAHWDAVLLTIADLLPPDNVDLYPEGATQC